MSLKIGWFAGQRKFAACGTNTGTKTPGKKETAQNKMKKYLLVMGELFA